jgi:hypothetical protein
MSSKRAKKRNTKYPRGLIRHPLYRIWSRIKKDCDENWDNYEHFYNDEIGIYF